MWDVKEEVDHRVDRSSWHSDLGGVLPPVNTKAMKMTTTDFHMPGIALTGNSW